MSADANREVEECKRAFDDYWANRPAMLTIGELWHAAWKAGRAHGAEPRPLSESQNNFSVSAFQRFSFFP
jgi:hypothetical protein